MEIRGTHNRTWKIESSEPLLCFKSRLNGVISGIDETDPFYIWTQFIHCLSLSYKFRANSKCSDSWAMIKKCQSIIDIMDRCGGCFADITSGLYYITFAMLCRFDVVFWDSKNPNIHNQPNIAAINGALAALLSVFGIEERNMRDCCDRAVKFHPSNELWHFVRAQCLKKFRNESEHHFASWKESLENVVKLANRPWPLVYAADEYRVCALYSFSQPDRVAMYRRSAQLYFRAGSLGKKSVFILSKVVIGSVYLPADLKNYILIKKYVHEIKIMKTGSAISYFALGVFHEHTKCFTKALDYYNKSTLLGFSKAARALFKLKHRIYESYNPTDDMVHILKYFPTDMYFQVDLLCQLASYEFFVNLNVMEAVRYWCKATEINFFYGPLMHHNSWFGHANDVNLLKEIGGKAKREYLSGQYSGTEQLYLRKVYIAYQKYHSDLQKASSKQEKLNKNQQGTAKSHSTKGAATAGEKKRNVEWQQPRPRPHPPSYDVLTVVENLCRKKEDCVDLKQLYASQQFENLRKWQSRDTWATRCSWKKRTLHRSMNKMQSQKLSDKCRAKYRKENRRLWVEYRRDLMEVMDQYSLICTRSSCQVADWWIVGGHKFRRKITVWSYFEKLLHELTSKYKHTASTSQRDMFFKNIDNK